MAGSESAAQFIEAAVASAGHAAQVDLRGRLQREGGVFLDPADHVARQTVHDGARDRTARGDLAHHADAAHGVDGDGRARGGAGQPQGIETAGRANDHAKAVVAGTRGAAGAHVHKAGGRERAVNEDLLTSHDRDACVRGVPDQAAGGVVATCTHFAPDLHVLRALQQHAASLGIHLRRGVHVQADALRVGARHGQCRACGRHATTHADLARHGGLAFPVNKLVRLDEEV